MSHFSRYLSAILLLVPAFLHAQQSMDVERVASGLSAPVFVTHAPGDSTRLFIVQRAGQIRILNLTTGNLNAQNFMTVPGVTSGNERGLLGLAFHPDYQTNGKFYVNYTDNTGGDTRVQEFTRTSADIGNPSSAVNVIEINQPQSNHNGGWIGFGFDNFLYVGMGDGGNGNDTGSGHTAGTGNAQDITNNLLGKILRLDIDNDAFPTDSTRNYAIPADNPFVKVTGDDEIFLYGIRNPWRCSFDRLTGDLWIGDVGQNAREEIDVYLNGSDADKNYGWRLREGLIATPGGVGGARPADNVDPVYSYIQGGGSFGGRCTTGGYVYRGPIADIRGHYFFADYISSRIWSFKYDGTTPFNGTNFNALKDWTNILDTDVGNINSISSFGEDAEGNLYIVDLGGEIFKIVDANVTTSIPVELVNRIRGANVSGSVADLGESDDSYLVYQAGLTLNPDDPPVWLEFEGTSSDLSPETLCFDMEAKSNTPGFILQTVEFFNYQTDEFEVIDSRNASLTDEMITVEATGDVSRFVDGDGTVKTKVTWKVNGLVSAFPWSISIDQALWRIVP